MGSHDPIATSFSLAHKPQPGNVPVTIPGTPYLIIESRPAHTSILFPGLCRPYGAKTIGVSLYPPLTQWATVVTLKVYLARLGSQKEYHLPTSTI